MATVRMASETYELARLLAAERTTTTGQQWTISAVVRHALAEISSEGRV